MFSAGPWILLIATLSLAFQLGTQRFKFPRKEELSGDRRKGFYLFRFAFFPFHALLHRPNRKQKSRLLVQGTGARLAGGPIYRQQSTGEVDGGGFARDAVGATDAQGG